MLKKLAAGCCVFVLQFLVLPSSSALFADDAAKPASGIDRTGFDTAVRPQDDFFRYVNGGWINRTEIPADKTRWGSFDVLREESVKHQRDIIEQLAASKTWPDGSEEKRIVDLYAALMDEALANRLGAAPVKPQLDRISQVMNHQELSRIFAELNRKGFERIRSASAAAPFAVAINIDSHNSNEYAVYVTQSGLGLPNRNYYLQAGEKFDEIRRRYPEYIVTLFTLAGFSEAEARARSVFELEMKLAAIQWSPEDTRDATKTDNLLAVDELGRLADEIDWRAYLQGMGLADQVTRLFVREPSYLEKLGELVQETPVETWKDYLRFHVLNASAPWLADEYVQAHFDFFGKLVSGQQELEPRWKRAVGAVDGALGDALGKLYIRDHFPPEAKRRMDELVTNVLGAFQTSIQDLDWMSDATKAKAEIKRTRLTVKIGYPEEWKDYSALEIRADDAVGNLLRAAAWNYDRQLARFGGPVDRKEWHMNPQTVNAYHNARLNEIVFPAAILQPPFFDMHADDAVNYGGIGMVIGHEIGHAFDDQGRKTDSNGNLNDWWTEQDATAFKARAQSLVDQYNAFTPLQDLHVNGQLTLGENIGDLTGVYISYKAYKASLNGKEAPVIDGLTGDQRFCLGVAQIWRSKYREEAIRRQVLTDPHSPAEYRVIGPLRNFGPFYKAFNVQPGDKMFLSESDRIRIW